MSPVIERRLELFRSRIAVRAWEYRQHGHAKGSWMRLRRVLADAEAAYAVSVEEAASLIAEGLVPEPVGAEFSPPRTIVFAAEDRVQGLTSRRRVGLCLSPELLTAPTLVLVPFPGR